MADLFNIAGKVAKEKLEPAGPQISIMSISGLPAIFRDKGGRISINGQDHSLAWINPKEKRILKGIGGSGEPGPLGIPAYYMPDETGQPDPGFGAAWGDDKENGDDTTKVKNKEGDHTLNSVIDNIGSFIGGLFSGGFGGEGIGLNPFSKPEGRELKPVHEGGGIYDILKDQFTGLRSVSPVSMIAGFLGDLGKAPDPELGKKGSPYEDWYKPVDEDDTEKEEERKEEKEEIEKKLLMKQYFQNLNPTDQEELLSYLTASEKEILSGIYPDLEEKGLPSLRQILEDIYPDRDFSNPVYAHQEGGQVSEDPYKNIKDVLREVYPDQEFDLGRYSRPAPPPVVEPPPEVPEILPWKSPERDFSDYRGLKYADAQKKYEHDMKDVDVDMWEAGGTGTNPALVKPPPMRYRDKYDPYPHEIEEQRKKSSMYKYFT